MSAAAVSKRHSPDPASEDSVDARTTRPHRKPLAAQSPRQRPERSCLAPRTAQHRAPQGLKWLSFTPDSGSILVVVGQQWLRLRRIRRHVRSEQQPKSVPRGGSVGHRGRLSHYVRPLPAYRSPDRDGGVSRDEEEYAVRFGKAARRYLHIWLSALRHHRDRGSTSVPAGRSARATGGAFGANSIRRIETAPSWRRSQDHCRKSAHLPEDPKWEQPQNRYGRLRDLNILVRQGASGLESFLTRRSRAML